MKKSSKKKYLYITLFLLTILLLITYSFKTKIYKFLLEKNILITHIQKLSIDEFIDITNFNKNISLTRTTNLVENKIIFDLFKYNKKSSNKLNYELGDALKDTSLLSIEKVNILQSKIKYKLNSSNKDFITNNSLILLPNESIICECYELLKSKVLIFENRGIAANKNETASILTLEFDGNKKETFKISNSDYTKVAISNKYNSKSLQISWTKNSSGVLFLHGIEKEYNNKKSLFISLKSKNLSNNFYDALKQEYINGKFFLNTNAFPIANKYKENLISLESKNSYINNGFTYKANDIFNENQKNLFNTSNMNFKSLLRINLIQPDKSLLNEDAANILISMTRKKSAGNIASNLAEIINYTNLDLIRLNIELDKINEDILLKLFKLLDKKINIFLITSDDFSLNEDNIQANQTILSIINDDKIQNILTPLQKIQEETPIQQTVLLDILIAIIENNYNFNLKPSKVISVQTPNDEYFIFNNKDFFSTKKMHMPLNNFNEYYSIIEEERKKAQLRDLSFTIFNAKNIKLKLTAKDKITRCFSDKNIKLWQIYFDSKTESYVVDLKIQSENVINQLQVNCLLYSEHFTNQYQIEFIKDNKPLEQLQFRVGEFLLQPPENLIAQNIFKTESTTDYSLLKSYNEHISLQGNKEIDLLLFSHYYPILQNNLEYFISYKEKK